MQALVAIPHPNMASTLDYRVIQESLERVIREHTGIGDVRVHAALDVQDLRWTIHAIVMGTIWKFRMDLQLHDWQELDDLLVQLKLSF